MNKMNLLIALFFVVLFISCDNSEMKTIEDELENNLEIVEEENAWGEFLPKEQELMQKLDGEYYLLSGEGEEIYYQDYCDFSSFDISVYEASKDSRHWLIHWAGEEYKINKVEETKNGIYITTLSESEQDFMFSHNENKLLRNFGSGAKEAPLIVRVEDLENFEIRPCTDEKAIIKDAGRSWYLVSLIDGIEVVFEPCMEAPGGFSFDEKSIDFWSGSDPYEIISFSKFNNKTIIVYQTRLDNKLDSLVVNGLNREVIHIKNSDGQDEYYVSERSRKELYPTLEEDCD